MLIDSHCHLPHKKYKKTIQEILDEAKKEGVTKVINIGTSVLENKLAIDTAKKYKEVYATVGIYPHEDINKTTDKLKLELEKSLQDIKNIVGIGECGFDITTWQGGRKIEQQIELFEMQIEVANKYKLPLVLHNRNGDKYILQMLNKHKQKNLRGVMHCFSSSWEYAQKILDLGFYISFSGFITYPSRTYLLEIVKNIPLDRFLVETDAPYLPPQGHRGKINQPKYVKIVAQKVAEIKKVGFNRICTCSYNNTCALFKL